MSSCNIAFWVSAHTSDQLPRISAYVLIWPMRLDICVTNYSLHTHENDALFHKWKRNIYSCNQCCNYIVCDIQANYMYSYLSDFYPEREYNKNALVKHEFLMLMCKIIAITYWNISLISSIIVSRIRTCLKCYSLSCILCVFVKLPQGNYTTDMCVL